MRDCVIVLQIEDIVPLFHTPPAAPLAEAAFAVVEDFATTQQLELVGCYYASDCTHESEPSAFAKKALAKLSSFNPAAVLLQVRSNLLCGNDLRADAVGGHRYSMCVCRVPASFSLFVTFRR